jgi:hypothetical protein
MEILINSVIFSLRCIGIIQYSPYNYYEDRFQVELKNLKA